ncbi:MAG: glycosyltransferase family 9 protein [candidate division Zixibacteria bacterium]|nr:glycosyltransferase family 9 protein [candidate division Zixibacteria bacterium]
MNSNAVFRLLHPDRKIDKPMPKKIEKILIIRFSSLGDVILTTPVIGVLKTKFPQSRIFFLTKAQYGDILRNDPRIFSLIEFDPRGRHKGISGFFKLIEKLRTYDFDLLVDLHANLRSFFVRHPTKSKIKLKYNKRWLSRFLMVHCKFLKIKAIHTVDSYMKVLKKMQINTPEKNPLIFLSRDDEESSRLFLLEQKVEKDDIVVGVHPGARWQTKRWDEGKFKQVCQDLIGRDNCKIMLLGDAGDEKLVEKIKQDLPNEKVINAVGLPLGRFMSLIRRCDCLIINDSGPMHIASALQVPVVAIFGPTHPKLGFSPVGSKNMVLCANVKCSPCSLHGEKRCSKKSRFCMDLIGPEMVVEVVEGLLD